MKTVTVKLSVAPLARAALVHSTVATFRAQPAEAETKVVPAGTASLRV